MNDLQSIINRLEMYLSDTDPNHERHNYEEIKYPYVFEEFLPSILADLKAFQQESLSVIDQLDARCSALGVTL